MGGFGSGRWHGRERRQVIEKCRSICSDDLSRQGPIRAHQEGQIDIHEPGGGVTASLPFVVVPIRSSILVIGFRLRCNDEIVTQGIPISTTQTRFGGTRLCFLCPTGDPDDFCGGASRRLYLPPGKKYFGCRSCHQLSYSACQKRKQRWLRAEKEADKLIAHRKHLLSNAKQSNTDFAKNLRLIRHLSHAIHDLIESLG